MSTIHNLMITMAALTLNLAPVAMAKDGVKLAKAEPNCEVKGKKIHVKDHGACDKKKGNWLESAMNSTPSTATTSPAPTPQGQPSTGGTETK